MLESFSECTPVSNPVFRFATVSAQGMQWYLKRNCSVTPSQLALMFASLCMVSIGIAVYFWVQGAVFVMPFALAELLMVGGAFVVYGRHATDGEKIWLRGAQLVVELERAGRLERAEFNREWVRIEPKNGDRSLIEVSGNGRRVEIGRFVRPELRPMLMRELRQALRGM